MTQEEIENLKDKYIVCSSINMAAYLVYSCSPFVQIIDVDGYKMFCIRKTEQIEKFYVEYNDDYLDIYVNLLKYNRCIKMLKNLCKNYKEEDI